jgi:hypothetical protein
MNDLSLDPILEILAIFGVLKAAFCGRVLVGLWFADQIRVPNISLRSFPRLGPRGPGEDLKS